MDRQAIAARLVQLRGRRSQSEVARELGISDSALSAYECGERIPRDELKLKMAEYFETSVQHLFFNEDDTKRDISPMAS